MYNLKIWKKNNSFDKKYGSKSPPLYPNEFLVKLCSSKLYSNINKKNIGKKLKVCEIGCFSGNNLRFFLDKGFSCYGLEVNNELISMCKYNLKKLKYKLPTLKIGTNTHIPYKDNFFDLLVSINTIHYTNGEGFNSAIDEFSRVLKKGGVAIIETPDQKSDIVKSAKKIGKMKYIWNYDNSFRDGIKVNFFDGKKSIENSFKKKFNKIEILNRTEKFIDSQYSWNIIILKK